MYKLTEIIDVKEIQTMAEHFYLLTRISHQLLDCNGGIIFHYGTPSSDIHLHTKIHVPIIFNENTIGDFVILSPKDSIESCTIYFKSLATIITNKGMNTLQQLQKDQSIPAEKLYTILHNMPVMVDACDEEGNIVIWNRECELVTGYSAAEIINNPCALELLYPNETYRNQLLHGFSELGKKFRDWEMTLTCKNGDEKTILWSNLSEEFPVPGYSHWAVGIDITHRKQVEEKLIEKSSELELIFKALPDLCFLTRLDGVIVDYKAGCPSRFYVPVEQFMYKKFQDVLPLNVALQLQEAIARVQQNNSIEIVDYSLLMHNSIYFFEARCLPLLTDKVMVMVRDITERKKTAELLNKSDKLATVGQLAAGVAHEVRNPLTVIKGFIQLLEIQMKHESKYFQLILSEIEHIESIIHEFLSIAKPEVCSFEQERIDVILENVVSLINTKAIMTNIHVTFQTDPDVVYIDCCKKQLKQVFINILQNSIEAMPHGGDIIITTKKVSNNEVEICISDEGIGIPEERIAKLAEPFYSTKEKGTGLGLMISYKIIESHQGRICITSKVGVGTSVYIYLPLLQDV
ncbi:PAS domain-containing sensor histidine kinase [Bacillus mycoides]|uniref:PAS domain-containing sensor histidine kinase n=1 Tax=Bacillus mycoides TaxID=1405 RepID=UPI00103AFD5F|nr:PAS domain-containing sensor histidine kinase [Bacillus mycoides]TBX53992.1 PAS domain-containing sensor histidine kinase [Bacillus mycoides]UNJ96875.1 ATP-binding protein [Bacillus mycoides]